MNTLKSILVFTLALMLACSNTKSPENSNSGFDVDRGC